MGQWSSTVTDAGTARLKPQFLAEETQPHLMSVHLADPRLGQCGSLIVRSLIWAMRDTRR